MQIGDLVFLFALFGIFANIGRVVWKLLRGPRASALRPLFHGAAIAGCYGAALLAASAIQAGRIIPVGVDECFDDWCIAVTAVRVQDRLTPMPTGKWLTILLRVSNRGRGRAQAEPDAVVYLRDVRGRRLDPVAPASVGRSVGDMVPAGESREVEVGFDVPSDFDAEGLVKTRRFNFPQIVLIGNPSSLFHRPAVHALGPLSTLRVNQRGIGRILRFSGIGRSSASTLVGTLARWALKGAWQRSSPHTRDACRV